MGIQIMGSGPKTLAFASKGITLQSGQSFTIPSGSWQIAVGPYTAVEWYDPVTMIWKMIPGTSQSPSIEVASDGVNYRVANRTGTVVGASVTNGGTATMTNGIYMANSTNPAITAKVTGTTTAFNVIVGGALNATVTVVSGGAGYVVPPVVMIDPPPQGGVQAVATATLTSGAVSSLTVTNVGAGYTTAPNIYFFPANGDVGTGASATCILDTAQSGKITALTLASSATGLTAIPSITFAGAIAGSPAATAIMCVTVTSAVASGATNNNGGLVFWGSPLVAAQSVNTNPAITTGLFQPRMGMSAPNASASFASIVVNDGGLHQAAPTSTVLGMSNGTVSGATTCTAVYGGVTDTSFAVPM